jgi:hypothetical protein
MKKFISTIFFVCGLVGMTSVTQAQNHHDGDNDNRDSKSSVQIVTGRVVDRHEDGNWDFVTFGLKAPRTYSVSWVEIFNDQGFSVVLYDLDGDREDGTTWFAIKLREYHLSGDFSLAIHITKGGLTGSQRTSSSGPTVLSLLSSPIEPEETTVIVRYP